MVQVFFFLFFVFVNAGYAKPMMAPEKVEALQSKFIVIAEYQSYKPQFVVDYFRGVTAQYKLVRILKGRDVPQVFHVRYDFQDGSACLEPKGWKFAKTMMPAKGSRWILFLTDIDGKTYLTYRGDFGRWEETKENLLEVEGSLR